MKCEKCNSERVCLVSGPFQSSIEIEPEDCITTDVLSLRICLDCGQAQGKWPAPFPVNSKQVEKSLPHIPFPYGRKINF